MGNVYTAWVNVLSRLYRARRWMVATTSVVPSLRLANASFAAGPIVAALA